MKQLLITIAALVLVGCGESQQSTPAPEPTTAKAPDISIHKAVESGNIKAVKQHLDAGTDVNAKDADGFTSLHYAARWGFKNIAELLITEGANVNTKNNYKETPLQYAANIDDREIVKLLITKGANVNTINGNGQTPLEMSLGSEMADLLRKHGAKTAEELKAEGK